MPASEERRIPCGKCGSIFSSWGIFGCLWCSSCRKTCDHPTEVHGHIVKRDGIKDGRRWCGTCGHMSSGVKKADIGPVCFGDHIAGNPNTCARCGARGTQTHHWAPTAIFGYDEAERWPTAELCPTCHRLWHTKMKAAKGYSLRGQEQGE